MYCLGLASEEETRLIESMVKSNPEVAREMEAIFETLGNYASASGEPQTSVKTKILEQLKFAAGEITLSFPPRLSTSTSVEEWIKYFSENKLSVPKTYEGAHIIHLPENETQSTYIAWAKKGTVVEEIHDTEERVFMVDGECEFTINEVKRIYIAGELIIIPKNTSHIARAITEEMVVVSQLLAA